MAEIFGVGRSTATTGMIYKWDGFAYEAAFNPEQGYWLFSPHGGTTKSFVGLPANGVVEMTSDWNLIGPVDQHTGAGRGRRLQLDLAMGGGGTGIPQHHGTGATKPIPRVLDC